jgi:hypothetical protein
MHGRRAALAFTECWLARRFHRPALQKEDQRKSDFLRNTSLHGCIAPMLASTFHPSTKLTESSLAPRGAPCEMPLRSAALY